MATSPRVHQKGFTGLSSANTPGPSPPPPSTGYSDELLILNRAVYESICAIYIETKHFF